MSVINKIAGKIKNAFKEAKFFPLRGVSIFGNNPFQFEFDRLSSVLKGYGQNPYVFSVINRIAERAVDVPYRVVDKDKEEIEVVNPFFASILAEPNDEGLSESLYRMFANYLSNETFIVETTALGFDTITGFIVPNSQDVQINTDSFGRVLSYDYSYLGNSVLTVPPEKVLHIKRPDITSQERNGRSNLIAGAKVYQSNNEIWGSEAELHKNKGIAGVLYTDGNRPLGAKEQRELQKKYDEEYTGMTKFGKVKVSTNKLGYIQMGMNPNDLKSIESRIDHLRTICALYNVDPKLFGDPNGSTYNNMPMAKLGLITDAVLPMLNKVMTELFLWLSAKVNEQYYYAPNLEDVPEMHTAKEQLSVRVGREVIQGILSPTQAREILYPHLAAEAPVERTGNAPVNDLIQIVQNVQNESISREAAVIMLIQLFGFDEDTANEILG